MDFIELLGKKIKSGREMNPDEARAVIDRYKDSGATGKAEDGTLFLKQQRTGGDVLKTNLTPGEIRQLCEERKIPWIDEYEGRVKRFLASDETVDSYGDIIKADGWDLKTRFKANPVIMWIHDYWQPPVGSGIKAKVENKKELMIDALFMTVDQYPWADTIFKMVDAGFLRGNSVGFIPLKILYVEDEDERKELGLGKWGVVFIKQILLEDSVCPIGSNPAALVQDGLFVKAVNKGILTKDELQRIRKDTDKKTAVGDSVLQMLDRALVTLDGKTLVVPNTDSNLRERNVIPYEKHLLADDDAAWGAGSAIKGASTDDLLKMCAWYNAEEADVESSYKLAHHHQDGFKTNLHAVGNAMATLKQAGIPDDDLQGVYDHLAKHCKDFGKEPPAFDDLKTFWDMAEFMGIDLTDAVAPENEASYKALKELQTALGELRQIVDGVAADVKDLADGDGGASPKPEPKSVYAGLFDIAKDILGKKD